MQTKPQRITGLSLGLILVGSALFPLINVGVGEAASVFYSSETKAVRTPPCRRPDGTRGPCASATPSPSPSLSPRRSP